MARYGFLINLHRCIGCRTCTVSCKMEHSLATNIQRIRVLNGDGTTTYDKPQGTYPNELEFLWRPTPCQHCTNPSCVEVCPTGATSKREEDGIVVVNKDECIGCESCVSACPYETRVLDPETKVIEKCDLCLHRLEAGLGTTMCQICCPNRAIMVGDLDDPNSEIAKTIAENEVHQLYPEGGTEPNAFYWSSVTKTAL